MKKLIFALLLTGSVYLYSCKEKTNDDPNPNSNSSKTKRELLLAGNWQLTSGLIQPPITIEIFGQVVTISDIREYMGSEECNLDDFLLFNGDGTITNDAGAVKCDPSDPQQESGGTWALLENDTKLRIVDGGDTTLLTLTELTATSMKGVSTMELENDTATVTHNISMNFTNIKK